jgi:hypothetical protein
MRTANVKPMIRVLFVSAIALSSARSLGSRDDVAQAIELARQAAEQAREQARFAAEMAREQARQARERLRAERGSADAGDEKPGEVIAFLGVSTVKAEPGLVKQLALQRGVGLRVELVTEGSAAQNAGIEQHDVLHRFNDQLLCNGEQLSTLVRLQKPGDEVTILLIRAGKPVELKVKLGQRVASASEDASGREDLFDFDTMRYLVTPKVQPVPGNTPGASSWSSPRILRMFPGGQRYTIVQKDENREVRIDTVDGSRHLTIKVDGNVIFDGPYNTPDEKSRLEQQYRELVEKVEADAPVPATTPAPSTVPTVGF